MIELPKYTVPTYDPRGLAVNERTDFTRRIPALPEKQKVSEGKAVDSFSRGDMETCFVSGAQSMEQLQEGSKDCWKVLTGKDF